MGQWGKANCCLNKKMEILEQIVVNNEAQSCFIHRREMERLNRTLGEREMLIRELNSINEELARDQSWKNMGELMPLIQDITYKEHEIMERSSQIIQEAVTERARIAAELKSNKARRQVKSQYMNPWVIMAPGRSINEKG